MAPRAKLQRQPKAGSFVGFELHAELIEESAVDIQLCHGVFVLTGKELEIVSRKRLGKPGAIDGSGCLDTGRCIAPSLHLSGARC